MRPRNLGQINTTKKRKEKKKKEKSGIYDSKIN